MMHYTTLLTLPDELILYIMETCISLANSEYMKPLKNLIRTCRKLYRLGLPLHSRVLIVRDTQCMQVLAERVPNDSRLFEFVRVFSLLLPENEYIYASEQVITQIRSHARKLLPKLPISRMGNLRELQLNTRILSNSLLPLVGLLSKTTMTNLRSLNIDHAGQYNEQSLVRLLNTIRTQYPNIQSLALNTWGASRSVDVDKPIDMGPFGAFVRELNSIMLTGIFLPVEFWEALLPNCKLQDIHFGSTDNNHHHDDIPAELLYKVVASLKHVTAWYFERADLDFQMKCVKLLQSSSSQTLKKISFFCDIHWNPVPFPEFVSALMQQVLHPFQNLDCIFLGNFESHDVPRVEYEYLITQLAELLNQLPKLREVVVKFPCQCIGEHARDATDLEYHFMNLLNENLENAVAYDTRGDGDGAWTEIGSEDSWEDVS